jgi:F-type H+-transporting ATPase subunit a
MAEEKILEKLEELTPTSYIEHHLTFLRHAAGEGHSFGDIHVDTVATSIILGIVGLGLIWLVVRNATPGVPSRRQAFVELMIEFVDDQVKGIFHGKRDTFIAPAALTVFVWAVLMNAMDFLPVDIVSQGLGEHGLGFDHFRIVPTADINTTFALALAVWGMMMYFNFAVKGFGGYMHELFCTPFGSNPLLWIFNLLFNVVELVSKPLSHSLRLYGNIYAGEIIFLLLGMWAATGVVGSIMGAILGLGWSIFHILIVFLQAYIFMMLTVVYLAMGHESH